MSKFNCDVSAKIFFTTRQILKSLGLNDSYKGFMYLILAVHLVIENTSILTYICKGLYCEIANNFGTSIYCVERNIRTIKNLVWKYGDEVLLKEIFGYSYCSKIPTNASFIDALSYYVKGIIDNSQ